MNTPKSWWSPSEISWWVRFSWAKTQNRSALRRVVYMLVRFPGWGKTLKR